MLPFHGVQFAQLSAYERRCLWYRGRGRRLLLIKLNNIWYLICSSFLSLPFSCSNGVSVEGATHKQVVDLIKSGGDCLTLTVISVTQQEADRLEPQEDQSGYSYIDYSDKRSLPIR